MRPHAPFPRDPLLFPHVPHGRPQAHGLCHGPRTFIFLFPRRTFIASGERRTPPQGPARRNPLDRAHGSGTPHAIPRRSRWPAQGGPRQRGKPAPPPSRTQPLPRRTEMPPTEIECTLHLYVQPKRTVPVRTRFSYSARDPYSVHITFHTPEPATTVRWVLARDLLADGMTRPSGLGDVRIWPAGTPQPDHCWLELSPPDGRALFTMPLHQVRPWLAQTYQLIPAGSEAAALDLDGELCQLLGEAA
ncbi:SsgA family sporulation/cell division regulator [Streptomyces sp. NPDC003832]